MLWMFEYCFHCWRLELASCANRTRSCKKETQKRLHKLQFLHFLFVLFTRGKMRKRYLIHTWTLVRIKEVERFVQRYTDRSHYSIGHFINCLSVSFNKTDLLAYRKPSLYHSSISKNQSTELCRDYKIKIGQLKVIKGQYREEAHTLDQIMVNFQPLMILQGLKITCDAKKRRSINIQGEIFLGWRWLCDWLTSYWSWNFKVCVILSHSLSLGTLQLCSL